MHSFHEKLYTPKFPYYSRQIPDDVGNRQVQVHGHKPKVSMAEPKLCHIHCEQTRCPHTAYETQS